MAAGGCAEGASRSAAVAKFMAVPLIGFVLLFVGNDVLSTFGAFATVASAVFLAVQAVMLIDFAYAWNEDWYAKALEARRGARASSGFQGWQMGILVASALLLLGSIAGTICLLIAVPDARARSVTAVAWVLAAVLLVVSITEHVKHGALLTSCVVMAYNAWLTWEAMSLLPGGRGPELPAWASLSVCAVSLLLFSRRAGGADAAADQDGPDPAAGACGEAGSSARPLCSCHCLFLDPPHLRLWAPQTRGTSGFSAPCTLPRASTSPPRWRRGRATWRTACTPPWYSGLWRCTAGA
ncbi:unnamed protein product [Prorocentrum cordatum]|nr:unnamed protein product [Polarella glacialis]